MSSPFPGMDPYLEAGGIFPGLHSSLIFCTKEILQAHLPEVYFAETGERVWVEVTRRYIEPDVQVQHHERRLPGPATGGSLAIEARAEPVVISVPHDEHTETFLEIYADKGEGIRLVTAIEVLSPSNKTPGEQGRDLYLKKQKEILSSKTNLVEIDLLRSGQHTTAVPLNRAREKTGPFDYHVCCHRFDRWEEYTIYPILLHQSLPEIQIPLLPGDPDVTLDLQKVFDRAYDAGPYRRRIRYHDRTPTPPLRPDQQEWMTKLLRDKGITA